MFSGLWLFVGLEVVLATMTRGGSSQKDEAW